MKLACTPKIDRTRVYCDRVSRKQSSSRGKQECLGALNVYVLEFDVK